MFMPKELERVVKALRREGYSEQSSWAIATWQYEKLHHGHKPPRGRR